MKKIKVTDCICPMCRKHHTKLDSHKWRYCSHCLDKIKRFDIVDLRCDEHRVMV